MSAATIRKKFAALVRAIEKDPELTLIDKLLGGKPPAARVDARLAAAGLSASEETRAYLGEIDGMTLAWVRGSYPNPQAAWDVWNASIRDDRAKIGTSAGYFKVNGVLELLHPPYCRIPDHDGFKFFDEYDKDSFYPIALDIRVGNDFRVRMGDDHGATFADGNPITLGGYLEMMIAGAGQGRNDLLLKHHTEKERSVLDAAGWFEEFDVSTTLKLMKGDSATIARWRALSGKVPAV